MSERCGHSGQLLVELAASSELSITLEYSSRKSDDLRGPAGEDGLLPTPVIPTRGHCDM
jgi:hypothetical protein